MMKYTWYQMVIFGVSSASAGRQTMRLSIISSITVLMLAGCASHIPLEIRQPPPEDLTILEVRDQFEQFKGSRVRWGGSIASIENQNNETWVEVVASPLDSQGRPRYDDHSMGRFIARMQGFLDPQVYARGRSVTVYGEVESSLVRPIGEYPYTYLLIRSLNYQLWQERDDYRYARPRTGVQFGFHHGFRYGTGFGFGLHHFHHIPNR
jgi:outer membrane lipoprotein